MSSFINKRFNTHTLVEPEHLHFASGVTSLCEMLGFAIFEPGDSILMSRPIYQSFKMDFGTRAK